MALNIQELDPQTVSATLGCVLKYKEDIEKLQDDGLPQIIEKARTLKERAERQESGARSPASAS
jgi:hypothetical protein